MNIEKIDEVFVPPSGERSPHLVSQAGQTFQLLLQVLNYHEVGVTLPVEYLQTKKIASKDFAKMVLGVCASVFSNTKRRGRTVPMKDLSER